MYGQYKYASRHGILLYSVPLCGTTTAVVVVSIPLLLAVDVLYKVLQYLSLVFPQSSKIYSNTRLSRGRQSSLCERMKADDVLIANLVLCHVC